MLIILEFQMADFANLISNEKNNNNVRCPFCNSLILSSNSGLFLKEEQKLPTVTQKKDTPAAETEDVSSIFLI